MRCEPPSHEGTKYEERLTQRREAQSTGSWTYLELNSLRLLRVSVVNPLPMRPVAWLTDPHFNFIKPREVTDFLERVAATEADAVLIGGDIGEAQSLVGYLRQIAATLPVPVYFVLGNHDFYYGSIREVRQQVVELCSQVPNLHWLGDGQIAELGPRTGLVGHDGWADARFGDYERSTRDDE